MLPCSLTGTLSLQPKSRTAQRGVPADNIAGHDAELANGAADIDENVVRKPVQERDLRCATKEQ